MALNIEGLLASLKSLIGQLDKVQKWRGNYAPNPHHFESVGPMSAGLREDRIWLKMPFTDGGVTHVIEANSAIQSFGKRGGDDKITLDGQDVDGDDLVIGHRFGWLYARIIVEFRFTKDGQKFDARFDGDL